MTPSKLTKLRIMDIMSSRPEHFVESYNSLVDAYNKLNETKPVGEWIYDTTIAGMRYYRCSICATGYHTIANECEVNWWRFCPRCGSKMFTKDKEE